MNQEEAFINLIQQKPDDPEHREVHPALPGGLTVAVEHFDREILIELSTPQIRRLT